MSSSTNVLRLIAAVSFSGLVICPVFAQTAKPSVAIGEVTARDVYIRCGPSQNHYPVCKVQPGDRVSIVGEKGEWLEILPVPGIYSLLSGEFVDTVDHKEGVVNGDNVRIRAGSLLTDDRYQVQVQLKKGDRVRILGKNDDGFLRIEPPAGVTLWVNGAYVERVSEARIQLESAGSESASDAVESRAAGSRDATDRFATVPAAPVTGRNLAAELSPLVGGQSKLASHSASASTETISRGTLRPASRSVADEGTPDIPSPLSALPPTAHRRALADLDRAADAEVGKPVGSRNLEPLIEQYRRIASQQEDELAQRYAEARITQLSQMAELAATVRRMTELTESNEVQRRKMMEERADVSFNVLPPALSGYDAQGELRTSALYPPGSIPRRFRLMDSSAAGGRTIAYVELPADSPIQVEAYLGRFVGIKALEKRIQAGGVNPIPIYIVRELTPLEPGSPAERGTGQS
jgi:uncharacterized protein YgiM (DUF1202 family)